MHGVQLSQNRIYWSCLNDNNDYEYEQFWGDKVFKLKINGNQVVCSVNGNDVFSFTKGIRMVSEMSSKIIEVVRIEQEKQKANITLYEKMSFLSVAPNNVYAFNGKFSKSKEVEFINPDKK